MEPYIADFLTNPKIPKAVRYVVLTLIGMFIEVVCVIVMISSSFLLGKTICVIIAVVMLCLCVYLGINKIHKS